MMSKSPATQNAWPGTRSLHHHCCCEQLWLGTQAWTKLVPQLRSQPIVPFPLFRGQLHPLTEQVPQIEGNVFP